MLSVVIASLVLAASPEFQARAVDGKQAAGQLLEVTASALTLESPAGKATLPFAALQSVSGNPAQPAVKVKPTVIVRLVDGSQLEGTSFEVAKGEATLKPLSGPELKFTTKSIAWVRLPDAAAGENLDGQWSDLLASQTNGKQAADLIVVRKKDAIDYLEGVLGDVSAGEVAFELDGQTVPVKRPRIEGLVYYHAKTTNLPETVCELTTAQGLRLSARTMQLSDDTLCVTTPSGLAVDVPLASLALLNFSADKVRYLSDLEADSVNYTPFFGGGQELPSHVEFFRPRRDVGIEQNPLRLDGKTYAKGLAMHSRTATSYRVPEKFTRFEAVVGIDDSVREAGHVQVTILGDGKQLWEAAVAGGDPARPVSVDLQGAKKLQIKVEFGDDLDVADHLDLAEARFTK
jgi:hypothetical protein